MNERAKAVAMCEWVDPETAKILDSYNDPPEKRTPPRQSDAAAMLGWVLIVVIIAVAIGVVVALLMA
jgi:CHASE3 domain sensor protein